MEQWINEFITLFLWLNIITFFYRKVFNLKVRVLNCGLFGWAGAEPPDTSRLKILGMYNQERGKHSCGIWYDGLLTKGIDKEAEFENLMLNNIIEPVKGSNVFIGHTRHATYGNHTLDNAHPFNVDNKLIIAHNGTIDNIWTLCHRYGVDDKDIHVDSLALGILLNRVGVKVLDEYKGAAALLMHKIDEPNSLWIYHGASKDSEKSEELEERPLYMLKVDDGIYFSSLEYALFAIRYNEGQVPEVVPYNKVIKITNGKITKIQIKVDRGKCNYKVEYKHPYYYPALPPSKKEEIKVDTHTKESGKSNISLVWYENIPLKALSISKDFLIYFHKGRYWYSVPDGTPKLCDGIFNLDKEGKIFETDVVRTAKYSFIDGVLLQSIKLYNKIREDKELSEELKTSNFARFISKYSRFPVTNLPHDCPEVLPEFRFKWYRSANPEKSGFTPKWSNRTYSFHDGVLYKISCPIGLESPLIGEVPQTKNKEEESKPKRQYSEAVNERMLFFDTVWASTEAAYRAMDRVCEIAYREYVKDSYNMYEERDLTDEEITEKVKDFTKTSVEKHLTILEALPQTGTMEGYIETVLDRHEIFPDCKKTAPLCEEYVESENGVYEPKKEDEDICLACSGLGISSIGFECSACGGAGRKKGSQKTLFTDEELTVNYEDSCSVTFEKSKDTVYEECSNEEDDKIRWDNEASKELVRENILNNIKNLSLDADELQALLYSDFGQDVANIIYKGLDNINAQLKESMIKYNHNELVKELTKKSILA